MSALNSQPRRIGRSIGALVIGLSLTTLPGAWLGGSIQQKRFSSITV